MTSIKLEYVSSFKDRHGKIRYRFRRKGYKTVMLPGPVGSAEFNQALAEAYLGRTEADEIGASRTKPGTLSALIVAYYNSAEWKLLAPSTQRMRRNILERFRAARGKLDTRPAGDRSIASLTRDALLSLRDKRAETPFQANKMIRVLHGLFAFAVDRKMLPRNPAAGIKPLKISSEGFHAWTDEEVAQYERRHPLGTDARLALELLACLGQRRADVVKINRGHVREDTLVIRQEKTGTSVVLPIADDLARALELVPKTRMTFLETSKGRPYSAAYFGNVFRRWCEEAGLPKHCRAHGLRKFAATRLADAGHSAHEIAAVTGHKRLADVAHYTRSADQKRLAEGVRHTLTRTKSEPIDGKPEAQSVKPSANSLKQKA